MHWTLVYDDLRSLILVTDVVLLHIEEMFVAFWSRKKLDVQIW
jgi:hypothetical protein